MKAVLFINEPGTGPWESIMHMRTQEMIRAWEANGVRLKPVTLGELARDPEAALRTIAAFGPDLLTAGNFNYLLLAALKEKRIFDLQIPMAALWDDPLGALVNYTGYFANLWPEPPPPERPWIFHLRNAADFLGRAFIRRRPENRITPPVHPVFKQFMNHPDVRHFAWDSGHVRAVLSLGLTDPRRVHLGATVACKPFLDMGDQRVEPHNDIAFCGNIYLNALQQHACWKDPFLQQLTNTIFRKKMERLERSVWDVLLETIQGLSPRQRHLRGLYTDQKGFWDFYLFVAWCALNALVRLEVLGGVRRQVNLFGLFADPPTRDLLGSYPNLRFAGNGEHFTELPRIYASSRINICVSNSLVYQGIPSKLLECLASGGFALCDAKEDLLHFFGPIAELIFFRNVDELNDKIEYYLPRPQERAAIVAELRRKILEHCTLEAHIAGILSAFASTRSPGVSRVA